MGGREVGGLANQLAAHMGFDDPPSIDRVRRFWDAPRIATRPGLKAVELFDAVLDGGIKALWILGTNPAVSMPRAGRVRDALAACPFVVVSDCWPTDTTRLRRCRPARRRLGREGRHRHQFRALHLAPARRSAAPPGKARPDWWMLSEVARRMGWGDGVRLSTGRPTFSASMPRCPAFENDGGAALSISARWPSLGDDDYDRLRAGAMAAAARRSAGGTGACLTSLNGFRRPTAGARFVADAVSGRSPRRPSEQWPLRAQYRPGARPVAHDDAHRPRAASDGPYRRAAARCPSRSMPSGSASRTAAWPGSRAGTARRFCRVRLSTDQRRGEVFAPMHWTDRFSSAGPIDRLVGAVDRPDLGPAGAQGDPGAR